MFNLKKQNLEKVRKLVETDSEIDPKIKDLVMGLRVWGIETMRSCQGHENARLFPWVTIDFKDIRDAFRILCEWNYRLEPRKPIIWVIDPMGEPMIRPLADNHTLEKIQEDAIKLGTFLQDLPQDFNWLEDFEDTIRIP